MKITVSNVIVVTDATPDVNAWCKKELTLPNPEYAKKVRMGFWVGNTPKTINLYEVNGNTISVPYGCLYQIPDLLDAYIHSDLPKNKYVYFGDKQMELYDYQQKAVDVLADKKKGILIAPAGSGKTVTGIHLVKRLSQKALWITNKKELLEQAKNTALQVMDKSLIGEITEGKVNIGRGITFATVQTLANLDLPRYKYEWNCIIVDESHNIGSNANSTMMFQKVLNNLAARHKYGLTATAHRSDGLIKAMYCFLNGIAHEVPESEVADKIMKVGIKPVSTGVELSRACLNTDGTLNYAKLINYLGSHADRNFKIYYELTDNKNKSCLILSARLEHLTHLISVLPDEMQDRAVMVSGKMTTKKGKLEREQAIEDMRTGKKKYLFATYSLAKEGLDIPCLERLFLTTPVKDYAVVTQSIGRIARTHEGKAKPIVYDFVDNIPYCVKAYKQRCRHYRKGGAYFVD